MATLKTNVLYSVLLNITNIIFPFVTAPYASRVLGVENMGIYGFATSYTSYFVLFAMLGIPVYGMRALSKCNNMTERTKMFGEIFTIVSISTMLVSIIYLGSIFFVPFLYEQKGYLLLLGVSLYLAPFNIDWFMSGREQFKMITLRTIFIKVLMMVCLFVFVRTGDDLWKYVLLTVGSLVLNHLWNWFTLLKYEIHKINRQLLCPKQHLIPIFILFGSTIAISIYTMLDTLMLGFMSTYNEVGYYASALKLGRISLMVVTSSASVVVVKISKLNEQKNGISEIRNILQKSFTYMFTFAVPITIGLITATPRFVPLFFGEEFSPAILPMQILSLLVVIIGVNNVFGSQILQGFGLDRYFLICVSVGAVINASLNFILIPSLGAIGASLASVLAEVIITILVFYYSRKVIKLSIQRSLLINTVLASLPIILVNRVIIFFELSDFVYMIVLCSMSMLIYISLQCFVFKNFIIIDIFNKLMCKIGK